jgi:hypothetical protein
VFWKRSLHTYVIFSFVLPFSHFPPFSLISTGKGIRERKREEKSAEREKEKERREREKKVC